MKTWLMSCACMLSLLSGCGGGGGGDVAAPVTPTPDPAIRYAAQFSVVGLSSTRLTMSPIAGESTIATRGVASVQVRANGTLLPTLTTPNTTNAAGQPAFQFDLPRDTFPTIGVRCGSPMRLEITVTDTQGMTFSRFVAPCGATDFGAFSDWGNRTLTFRITANTPVEDGRFNHFSRASIEASNAGLTIPGESSKTWAGVPAREGDQASITATIPADAPDNAQVEVSIESNGVVLARSLATKSSGRTANASVVCCQGSTPSATASRTVLLVLFPSPPGVYSTPVPFNLHYRVFNTAAQQVAQEFAGTPPGPTPGTPDVYTFSVRPGDELTLEASPLNAGERVDMYIYAPADGVAHELGSIVGGATVPNVPSLLHVFCCSL